MFKKKIDKAAFDALSDAHKALYVVDGEGYKLNVEIDDDAPELRRAKEREKARADEAERKLAELNTRLEELEGGDARKRGDIATLEKSWKDKLDAATKKATDTITALRTKVEQLMTDNSVTSLASEIFTKPSRDVRLLKDRVKVEWDGDTPTLRVLDKDGKPSALSLDDLRKETVDNAEYKDILLGSRATGSGGTGGNNRGGAPKQPAEYSDAERIELYRTNRAEFERLFPTQAV
jgi:hypothetical protein